MDEIAIGLDAMTGHGKISCDLESSMVTRTETIELVDGYRAMAKDVERERQALEWIEALVGDSLPSRR
jgi:hypothetical protein